MMPLPLPLPRPYPAGGQVAGYRGAEHALDGTDFAGRPPLEMGEDELLEEGGGGEGGADEEDFDRNLPWYKNCALSTILGLFLCIQRCDLDKLVVRFAFFPPNPSTYRLHFADGSSVGHEHTLHREE